MHVLFGLKTNGECLDGGKRCNLRKCWLEIVQMEIDICTYVEEIADLSIMVIAYLRKVDVPFVNDMSEILIR